jgi:hypothetical protein
MCNNEVQMTVDKWLRVNVSEVSNDASVAIYLKEVVVVRSIFY